MKPDLEELLCRRLDGLTSSEEGAQLDAILAVDPAARRLARSHQRLDAVLRDREVPEVDLRGFRDSVMAAIATEAQPLTLQRSPRKAGYRASWWLSAAAALIVSAWAARYLVSPGGIPQPQPQSALLVEGPLAEQSVGQPMLSVSVTSPETSVGPLVPWSPPTHAAVALPSGKILDLLQTQY